MRYGSREVLRFIFKPYSQLDLINSYKILLPFDIFYTKLPFVGNSTNMSIFFTLSVELSTAESYIQFRGAQQYIGFRTILYYS